MRVLGFVFVLCLLGVPHAACQSTWNGLRFGMTFTQAMQALDGRGLRMEVESPSQLRSAKDYELRLPGLSSTLPMVVDLRFDGSRLVSTNLEFDINEFRRRNPSVQSDEAAVSAFGYLAYEALDEKYGKPLTQSGSCAVNSLSWDGCSVTWRAGNQSVGLVIVAADGACSGIIGYEPLAGQL